MSVYRIYVEKKPSFAVEAAGVLSDLRSALHIESIRSLRLLNRYDAQNISPEDFEAAKLTVFSEPQVDEIYDELPQVDGPVFAIEFLPGQFDQRADSCAQCIQISTQKERPLIHNARVYLIEGNLTDDELTAVKKYLINPIESREASLDLPETLETDYPIPTEVETLEGFCQLDQAGLDAFVKDYGLAMDLGDALCCQAYFKDEEKRDPTITEIRMLDTYWSDHCRHTTFHTVIDSAEFGTDYIEETYHWYRELREQYYGGKDRPVTLMDLATIGAKSLRKNGLLDSLDQSEEVNACSVKIKVKTSPLGGSSADAEEEDWLLMFKNETHNHPTEIEPFGGAATCLGGAIRDPLSGRSYVYQAMRLTGSGDPFTPVSETLPGKLPQRRITTTAAAGYSSYGNQIGLATGHVTELYHPGYVAKRMEVGAVIGAAPVENVVREVPAPSDVILLLGGKTGRDGCGGATGSSKSHTTESLESCGAEVQKGNAPEERKIQRLFRNPTVTRMIRRCNDFGAGGVSVAIGELAEGVRVNLDAVPKKYDGLDGTELAISESQERMAVVVSAKDCDAFIEEAAKENLTATPVAVVTEERRLVMEWNGREIVNLSRDFIDSSGSTKHASVKVQGPDAVSFENKSDKPLEQRLEELLGSLNVCSQKGLLERFDFNIGASTVLAPLGGKRLMTPTQAMVAKLPMLEKDTTTCSVMGWGFDPYLSEQSPYHGAMLAVVQSIAKVIAVGGSRTRCWLSFQEYFEKLGNDPARWGKPFAALLGALKAQMELSCGAIGGKDSMSGSFEDLDVPPTLISFAVSTTEVDNVISPEFKAAGNPVYLIRPTFDEKGLPVFDSVRETFEQVEALIRDKKALSAWSISSGGVAEGVVKMCVGNAFGFAFEDGVLSEDDLFTATYGGFLLECAEEVPGLQRLGTVTGDYKLVYGGKAMDMGKLEEIWEEGLAPIFPFKMPVPRIQIPTYSFECLNCITRVAPIAKPRAVIATFPGSNSEYDTARAFQREGGEAEIFVIRNRNPQDVEESIDAFVAEIKKSQIVALPGGFSGGDEPDGSGKFITAFFRNPKIAEAIHEHLYQNDGLMVGICNGFQALVKLGLIPYGQVVEPSPDIPTLTLNKIGRHQSTLANTRISSNLSPWLMYCPVGEIYRVSISHGEGQFVASPEVLAEMAKNGQIATQFVDLSGNPSLDVQHNPNGSLDSIESATSPDGRVLGKMGHSERYSYGTFKNVPGEKFQPLFRGAVHYYTK